MTEQGKTAWISATVRACNRRAGFNPYATAPRWLAARDTVESGAYSEPRNEREARVALAPMGWRTAGG